MQHTRITGSTGANFFQLVLICFVNKNKSFSYQFFAIDLEKVPLAENNRSKLVVLGHPLALSARPLNWMASWTLSMEWAQPTIHTILAMLIEAYKQKDPATNKQLAVSVDIPNSRNASIEEWSPSEKFSLLSGKIYASWIWEVTYATVTIANDNMSIFA